MAFCVPIEFAPKSDRLCTAGLLANTDAAFLSATYNIDVSFQISTQCKSRRAFQFSANILAVHLRFVNTLVVILFVKFGWRETGARTAVWF